MVVAYVTVCDLCQRFKKQKKSYGHLPPKDAEATPWRILCVDLIGPYTISRKKGKPFILSEVKMIDTSTNWFEIAEIPNKESSSMAKIVEQTWLVQYPRPLECVYGCGSKFILTDFQAFLKDEVYE